MLTFILLFASLNNNEVFGVELGAECWSTANGVTSGGCVSGTHCAPWLPEGGSWDGASPWYCLAKPKLIQGASCNYAKKIGLCATGLTCISGSCTDVPNIDIKASTTPTTTTKLTTTTTAAVPCTVELNGGDICKDTQWPDIYANRCCKTPYTCEPVPGSTRISMCNGVNLPKGSTCWSNEQSNGTCDSSTKCKTPGSAKGTCEVFRTSSNCVATGVMGYNLCYYSELGISLGSCCNDFNTGSSDVNCLPDISGSTKDRFCMQTKIPLGNPCGWTAAENYAGFCDANLKCVNGVCVNTDARICSGLGAKCWDGANTQYMAGVTCCNQALCDIKQPITSDYYCPDTAGAATCADNESPPGTKCWDGSAVVTGVTCCYGKTCPQPSGTPGNCP